MRKLLRVLVVMIGLVLSQTDITSASAFKVAPIKVFLTAQSPTALLALTNTTDQPLRFQISAFSWSQSRTGELLLAPTEEIVFFPALLTLNPGQERNVRVGFTKRVAPPVEQTYRIFFEELPAAEAAPAQGAQIKVLTKMGIPIFVAPKEGAPQLMMDEPKWPNQSLSFSVLNKGKSHFSIRSVKVTGLDASGSSVFSKQFDGWYVLSGGARDYVVPLQTEHCAAVKEIDVQITTDIVGEEASGRSFRWKAPSQLCSPIALRSE